jgi:hypothetical protein
MAKTDSPINSPLLPAAVNALVSALLTYPPWTKLLLWELEYPSFVIAVIAAVIGTVVALQFTKGDTKLQIFWGIVFCCAVIGYYVIWSMNGSPTALLYFGVFLIFVMFLIGGYFLTLLLVLLFRRQNSDSSTTPRA